VTRLDSTRPFLIALFVTGLRLDHLYTCAQIFDLGFKGLRVLHPDHLYTCAPPHLTDLSSSLMFLHSSDNQPTDCPTLDLKPLTPTILMNQVILCMATTSNTKP
jgi:hypothetical protein